MAQAITLPGIIAKIRHLMPDPDEAVGEAALNSNVADLMAVDAAQRIVGFGPYEV